MKNLIEMGESMQKQAVSKTDKKLISSIGWKLLERSSVQVINLVIQIVLARLLSPDKFGSLSIILVFYNIADLIVQKGFGSAIVRKDKITDEDRDSVFIISMIIAILSFGVMFVSAPLIGEYYGDMELVGPLRILGASLLFSPLYCVCNALLIREMRFKAIFVRGLIATCISGGVGILFAIKGYGLWALVIQILVNQIVLTVVMCINIKYLGGFRFSKKAFWDIFNFGKNVLLTEFMLTTLESLRILLIGKNYSEESLAYYDRGQTYPSTLMRAINDTLFGTMLPYFSKIQNDLDEVRSAYKRVLEYTNIVVFPVFIGLAAISDNIIYILLTDKWAQAIPYMQIFCVYQAIFTYQIVSKAVIYSMGDSKRVLKLEIIKSGVSFILMLLSMHFGTIWVAGSLIIVRLISDILYIDAVKKMLDNVNVLPVIWKPIVASGIMFGVIKMINHFFRNIYMQTIFEILVGVCIYIVVMMILDKNVKQMIKHYFRRNL